ncbi:hypothetical protein DFR33_10791 [Bradymonas sediminis]|nr:hypothetical protein DFR33_10791 [Bradymonas sediminis]
MLRRRSLSASRNREQSFMGLVDILGPKKLFCVNLCGQLFSSPRLRSSHREVPLWHPMQSRSFIVA